MKKLFIIGIITLLLLTTFIPGISEGSGGAFELDELMQKVLEEQSEQERTTTETTLPYREYDPEQDYDPNYIDYIPSEVIVGFKPCHNVSQMDTFLNHTITDKIEVLNMALVQVDQGEEVTFIQELENRSDVYFAERNMVGVTCWEPNDPGWESQWGPGNIKCPEAWDIEKGDSSIVIAILDSGIDYNHPDLEGNMWVNELELNGEVNVDDDGNGYVDDIRGWNVVNDTGHVKDEFGHGTACAGIAAAEINNAIGIAGVANVTIMPVVIGPTGFDLPIMRLIQWVLAKGIIYAARNDAWVISMSCGHPRSSYALRATCYWAYKIKKCLIVAAAGNDGNTPIIRNWVYYPGGFPSVISVGATNQQDERFQDDIWSSNHGVNLELMAPGIWINTTMPTYHVVLNDVENKYTNENITQNYDYGYGTSTAVPHVAGVAALYYSEQLHDDPAYEKNPKVCRDKLRKTALDLPPEEGRDIWTGYGLVQADDMLTKNIIYTEVVGNGSISFSPNQDTYEYSSVVQLTANPSLGWIFVGWSGDLSSGTSQESITVDGDKYIIATFTE